MFNFTTWVTIALIASVIANIIAFWYIRRVLVKLLFVSGNIADLVVLIRNYNDHLKSIYQLEMYHGDETIKFLMSHTTSLVEMLEEYQDVYSITVPIEEEPEDAKGTEKEDEDATPQINEKNVFYAGSRKRDN